MSDPLPKKGLNVRPNVWAQFSMGELRAIVKRKYPDFGTDQIRNFPEHTLIELIEIRSGSPNNPGPIDKL